MSTSSGDSHDLESPGKMYKNEVKPVMPKIINGKAALTSFQDCQSYVKFLFSEWRIILKADFVFYDLSM